MYFHSYTWHKKVYNPKGEYTLSLISAHINYCESVVSVGKRREVWSLPFRQPFMTRPFDNGSRQRHHFPEDNFQSCFSIFVLCNLNHYHHWILFSTDCHRVTHKLKCFFTPFPMVYMIGYLKCFILKELIRIFLDPKSVELWESYVCQKVSPSHLVWLKKYNWEHLYTQQKYKQYPTLGVDSTPSLGDCLYCP